MRNTLLAIVAAALIAFGGGIAVGHSLVAASGPHPLQGFDVYNQALSDIQQHYVNAKSIDEKTLVYGSIRGMVEALGDTGHSRFMTPEEYAAEQQSLNSQYTGIGFVGGEVNGVITVVRVLPNTPAEKAGIKAGDQIIAVDGNPTAGQSFDQVSTQIRGPAGTSVKLTILHEGAANPVDISVTRAVLNLPLVDWSFVPGTKIADVALLGFDKGADAQSGAAEQVWAAIQTAKSQGATGLIFDLRGNPGGYVDEAVNTTSLFLSSGNVFIQVFADGSRKDVPVNSDPNYHRTNLPLVVLADNSSASAAEIVSGALQDAARAKVVGVRTFGTGTVLDTFRLSDGSVLLLGTSKFLTRAGHEILNTGITPNVEVALPVGAQPLAPSDLATMSAAQFDQIKDTQLQAAMRQFP